MKISKSRLGLSRHLLSHKNRSAALYKKCFVELYHTYFVTARLHHPLACIPIKYVNVIVFLLESCAWIYRHSFTKYSWVLRAKRYITYCIRKSAMCISHCNLSISCIPIPVTFLPHYSQRLLFISLKTCCLLAGVSFYGLCSTWRSGHIARSSYFTGVALEFQNSAI